MDDPELAGFIACINHCQQHPVEAVFELLHCFVRAWWGSVCHVHGILTDIG